MGLASNVTKHIAQVDPEVGWENILIICSPCNDRQSGLPCYVFVDPRCRIPTKVFAA